MLQRRDSVLGRHTAQQPSHAGSRLSPQTQSLLDGQMPLLGNRDAPLRLDAPVGPIPSRDLEQAGPARLENERRLSAQLFQRS